MSPDAAEAPGSATRSQRTILHVDMDAFYVSVELRDRPELRGRPVVVGGTGPRGVVAAASYEARRYGLRSAMPTSTARRMCPHAVFLPGDHRLYAEVSREVHAVFAEVTPLVEPLALDEAFLDVSGALRLLGEGTVIAQAIRQRVSETVRLTCSVGVAPNKFLAKLASKSAKPQASPGGVTPGAGVVEVLPGSELAYLHPLPVQALWGVGPATLERLQRLGVRTVGDLAALDVRAIQAAVGKAAGRHLYDLSWARDERAVEPERELKSIGHEETFAHDRCSIDELDTELVRLADGVASRLRANDRAARTITLKVRFASFATITRSVTVTPVVTTAYSILQAARPLLAQIDPTPGVRLLGISVSNFAEDVEQLNLLDGLSSGADVPGSDGPAEPFLPDDPTSLHDWRAAEGTVDEIRRRFGASAIGPASASNGNGVLRLVRPGAQQWGPDHDPAGAGSEPDPSTRRP
jgi:DNA polymerase IV